MGINPREWYLKWLRGSVEAYLKYRVSGKDVITLENIVGRFRSVIENGYLTREGGLGADRPGYQRSVHNGAKGY